jgi:hypothetical protein
VRPRIVRNATVGVLLVASVLSLTGCALFPSWGTSADSSSPTYDAETNVRTAIPALEAYYADKGTYRGATVKGLRSVYDQAMGDVALVKATSETYCVESRVGRGAHKNGPADFIRPGLCPR